MPISRHWIANGSVQPMTELEPYCVLRVSAIPTFNIQIRPLTDSGLTIDDIVNTTDRFWDGYFSGEPR
jgi:hypothetical protein